MDVTDRLKIFTKKLNSYFKSNWTLNDYPLRYNYQGNSENAEVQAWVVQVLNWWHMIGLGDTKEEAYQNLSENFEAYKLNNDRLPRPGSEVPFQFADTDKIDHLEYIAVDFFDNILEMEYYDCFISDESSLLEFGIEESELLRKIIQTYDLQLTEIGDGNIVRLLTLIEEKN